MTTDRDELARKVADETGQTIEQVEAFFDILGSAFARSGYIDGPTLTPDELDERLTTFLGEQPPTAQDPQ